MPTIENYGTLANTLIKHDGVIRSLKEWAEYYQLNYKTVAMRYKRGHKDPAKLFFKSKVGLSIREMADEPEIARPKPKVIDLPEDAVEVFDMRNL